MELTLPPGDWYDFWTAQKHASSEKLTLHPAIADMPLYIRAGAIIPMQPLVQAPAKNPTGHCSCTFIRVMTVAAPYIRTTVTHSPISAGEFLRINYSCQVAPQSLTVTATTETSVFQPFWNSTEVTVFARTANPNKCALVIASSTALASTLRPIQ